MRRISQDKRFNEFLAPLFEEGWTIERSKKHYKLCTPDGMIAGFVSTTPSDRNKGLLNFRAMIRRLKKTIDTAK